MKIIRDHLKLKNPRFICRDTSERYELSVSLSHTALSQAKPGELDQLRKIAGSEAEALIPLYSEFNGIIFHQHGETAGLMVASVDQLEELNSEWREWFRDIEPEDLYDFQRNGLAFANIAASANFFVVYGGKVYYSDHDGGDDTIWGDDLELFFNGALSDPARFLSEAGCYTRYSDGRTDRQFIPESFVHD